MAVINTQRATLESRGYKQTAAGRIPADWQEFTIGELIRFEGGSQPDKSHFRPAAQPGYVRMIQIRDYKSDRFEVYVPQALARRFCTDTDIMIGRYGPPVFQILRGLAGAYNVALIKAIPLEGIEPAYAFYFLKNEQLFSFIDKLSRRSSGQTGVDLAELRAYPLPLPPLREEQVAIATALADADTLIDSLEQLLTKKRQIKQGAMTELFAQRRRLPGFSDRWEHIRIGEFTDCTAGGTPSTRVDQFWGGEIPWMSSGDLHQKRVQTVEGRITEEGLNNSSTKWIPERCVLIGLAGQGKTRGTVAMNLIRLCTNQSIAAIFPSEAYDPDFLYHNLDWRYEELRELSAGDGGRGGLNLTLIRSILVPKPSLEEQRAVAAVLADMDADINATESRLTKARAFKQAMAQALLTGRIRLVEPNA